MGQRVRKSHRGIKVPSSSGQLPVPVALDARSPTLFSAYYTRFDPKCKEFFSFLSYFFLLPESASFRAQSLSFLFQGKRCDFAGFPTDWGSTIEHSST